MLEHTPRGPWRAQTVVSKGICRRHPPLQAAAPHTHTHRRPPICPQNLVEAPRGGWASQCCAASRPHCTTSSHTHTHMATHTGTHTGSSHAKVRRGLLQGILRLALRLSKAQRLPTPARTTRVHVQASSPPRHVASTSPPPHYNGAQRAAKCQACPSSHSPRPRALLPPRPRPALIVHLPRVCGWGWQGGRQQRRAPHAATSSRGARARNQRLTHSHR